MKKTSYIQEIILDLFKQLQLDGIADAEKIIIMEKIEEQITRRLGYVILSNLSVEGLQEYEVLMKKNKPSKSEMGKLIKKYIPEYEKKIKLQMEIILKEIILAISK